MISQDLLNSGSLMRRDAASCREEVDEHWEGVGWMFSVAEGVKSYEGDFVLC